MAESKKKSKKVAKKVTKAEPAPKAKPKWPLLLLVKTDKGDIRRLKVGPGIDGPVQIEDGRPVLVPSYHKWEILGPAEE